MSENTYIHDPVLLHEILSYFPKNKPKKIIDCTLGLGGHLNALIQNFCTECQVLAFDQDKNNIHHAKKLLKTHENNIVFVHDNFKNLIQYARNNQFEEVDNILFDLGLSSPQVDHAEKGFSFKQLGPLDMRFNKEDSLTAEEIINEYSENDLAHIFRKYGEIPQNKSLARKIVSARKESPIKTTLDLVKIIHSCIHPRIHNKITTLTFQALRIEVNNELNILKTVLPEAISLLKKGGRIMVISYHSLEDRIVKDCFRYYSQDCHCDKTNPICTCNFKPSLKRITKKPLIPSEEEIQKNPRSRSAKLRIAEKI